MNILTGVSNRSDERARARTRDESFGLHEDPPRGKKTAISNKGPYK